MITNKDRVLIIDDDRLVCNSIGNAARALGYEVCTAFTLHDGLASLIAGPFDVVFLDTDMPDGNSVHILPQIQENPGHPEIIVITTCADPESAAATLSQGAWDYLEKPFTRTVLTQTLHDVMLYRKSASQTQQSIDFTADGIIAHSTGMQECLNLLNKTAHSDANVLITGETGTGKELFAKAIHNHSGRYEHNFVVVDCAALPANLVESILFGHEKGSYTGADKSHSGLISQAHKGTLFLDEIGELPLESQKNFLRTLQEGSFRPVGNNREYKSDFRVIAATNRNLESMVEQGLFRKDLLYRLRSISIHIPALRERKEDIPALAEFFLNRFIRKSGMPVKTMSKQFQNILTSYSWQGNVRELLHAIESSLALAYDSALLVPKHLPMHINLEVKGKTMKAGKAEKTSFFEDTKLPGMKEFRDETLANAEKNYLHELMQQTGSNVQEACAISGLSRSRLYALLKKHEIS